VIESPNWPTGRMPKRHRGFIFDIHANVQVTSICKLELGDPRKNKIISTPAGLFSSEPDEIFPDGSMRFGPAAPIPFRVQVRSRVSYATELMMPY